VGRMFIDLDDVWEGCVLIWMMCGMGIEIMN
jgi:hypothetical protein